MGEGANLHKTLVDLGLLLAVAMIALLQLGALPLLFHPGGVAALACIAIAALSTPMHYGLMHETMHGNLFRRPELNRRVGRLLGITLGLPWETMRFGHLAHHSNNRHKFDRPEYRGPEQSYAAVAPVYYLKLVIGNALIYALAPLLIFLPVAGLQRLAQSLDANDDGAQIRAAALRSFSNPARRVTLRIDIAAIILLGAVSLYLWGAQWWVFAACVFARWSVLSLLDNAPHYALPLTSGLEARNTHLPSALRWLVLNQNFHGTHHHTPNMHWTDLPDAFRQSALAQNGSWIAAVVRQFRGPVALS